VARNATHNQERSFDFARSVYLPADNELQQAIGARSRVTEIPEAGYSFAVLKWAQALGDVETLQAHERRTVRIHVSDVSPAAAIEELFADALQ
jgi:hypothetical protein